MKKLYTKMLLSTFCISIIVLAIYRFVFMLFQEQILSHYSNYQIVLISMIVIASVIMIINNIWFNFMFIRRLANLTSATKNISQGKYNQHLDEFGHDEISQLTHHFNVMSDELQNNQYLNQSFMKDYAHEFKTPISIIKGYGELIGQSNDIDEINHYAKIIVSESRGLSALAQNILELSLLNSNIIVEKKDVFNISEACRNIIQSLQPKWEEKKLELDLNFVDIEINSNKELVNIMLRNLIDNAIKYAYDNSSLHIKISSNEHIKIDIINQGPVIKDKDISKIFDLFYRSEMTKDADGHGVGLSIVDKIIKKLDYRIEVESNDNLTRFSIII